MTGSVVASVVDLVLWLWVMIFQRPHYVTTKYSITIIHPSIPHLSMCLAIPVLPIPQAMPSHLTIGSSQDPAIPYQTTKKSSPPNQKKILKKDQQ